MKKIFVFGSADKYANYGNAIIGCGGDPFFSEDAAQAESCAGLVLPGGGDVDPALYGQENRGSFQIDADLDRRELEVIRAFSAANLPILGICRGLQILNVALGGTLIQDLPTATTHRWTEDTGDQVHAIQAVEKGFLFPLYGAGFPVNSAHHQGIHRLAEGLQIAARAEDGVIEAVEDAARRIYAVQFHPERMCFLKRREDTVDGSEIFRFFLGLC